MEKIMSVKKKINFSIDNYVNGHAAAFRSMDTVGIQKAIDMVVSAIRSDKKIITCGNGGSASTASHYITDWNKMFNLATGKKFRGISLTDNVGLITAFGNDMDYDQVFAGQISAIMDEGDLLVVVSGSGNSPNILSAIKTAREQKGKVLGVLGYDGGHALAQCDEVFHTPSWDMQICEDIHLSFGHLVMKTICSSDIYSLVESA
jgi:D-sedoheptulose 7-phosphate isomerase